MTRIALLGIPNDDNSSYLRGAAEAPARIRAHLFCDAYSTWSETGFDLGAPGAVVDHGDLRFDAATDPWEAVEHAVVRAIEVGDPLLCLGGDHAGTSSRVPRRIRCSEEREHCGRMVALVAIDAVVDAACRAVREQRAVDVDRVVQRRASAAIVRPFGMVTT